MKYLKFFLLAFAALTTFASFVPAHAGGPIHLTVTNCNDDVELREKIDELQNGEGGTLHFDCGIKTIAVTQNLQYITYNTLIDGGNKITLNRNYTGRFFSVQYSGALTLKNIILEKASVTGSGGAISGGGALAIDSVTFRDNAATAEGGAIAAYNAVDIRNSTFSNNHAGYGGAIYAMKDQVDYELKIADSKFINNSADDNKWGGAINASVKLNIARTVFESNHAGSGGAIYSNYSTDVSTILDSSFSKNYVTGTAPNANGGAIWLDYARMQIARGTFQENLADAGGAIHLMATSIMDLSESNLEQNQAVTGGGGIYNKGTARVYKGTLFHNSAGKGGGIDNFGDLTLHNATLSDNRADYGGGLANENGLAGLNHVTFAKNIATVHTGAILNQGIGTPGLVLSNVLVADSQPNSNCFFPTAPLSVVHSLSSDDSCGFATEAQNLDLKLGALANHGGFTRTHLPLPGSPALDKGYPFGFTEDQRGIARPQGAAVDVGAVEVTPNELCAQKPAKPVLVKPGNTKNDKGPTVALDWQDAQCAQSYKIIVRLGTPQGATIQKKGGLENSAFTTKPLAHGQTYVWRVFAKNAFGKTKSDWWTFTAK